MSTLLEASDYVFQVSLPVITVYLSFKQFDVLYFHKYFFHIAVQLVHLCRDLYLSFLCIDCQKLIPLNLSFLVFALSLQHSSAVTIGIPHHCFVMTALISCKTLHSSSLPCPGSTPQLYIALSIPHSFHDSTH